MVNTVKLSRGKSHYNPPEYYAKITNADTFINENVISSYDVDCPISGHIGTVRVPFSADNFKTTVVTYIDNDCNFVYVGTVKTLSRVSASEIQIIFDVDWYTSQTCSYLKYTGNKGIVAKTVLNRRITGGKFDYKDEGFVPKNYRYVESGVNVGFLTLPNDFTQLLIYNETETNSICWIICNHSVSSAQGMWAGFFNIAQKPQKYEFNPKNVLFFGYTFLPFDSVPKWSQIYGTLNRYATLNQVIISSDGTISSNNNNYPFIEHTWTELHDIDIAEYGRALLMGAKGEVLFEFPIDSISGSTPFKTTDSIIYDPTNPAINCRLNDAIDSRSFSIPFYAHTFMVDSQQVYNVEERVYNREMRNMTTLNNLVSGVTGAATTGAMVYGFSRNGNRRTADPNKGEIAGTLYGLTGAQKGLIGFGVGAAGSLVGAGYDYLYANKEAQSIEDRHSRVLADNLLLSLDGCYSLAMKSGLYYLRYDQNTIDKILAYNNKFGFADDSVRSNVNLISDIPSTRYYIQADIMLVDGLRKDVENYIINMFANGVTFNE